MRNWTRDEIILALYAYCHVPFKNANNNHPWIFKIANLISRTPASVKMKIGNLGSFDPLLKNQGIRGLTKVSKIDKEIWNEYYGKWDLLAENAEYLISKIAQERNCQNISEFNISDFDETEKFAIIKKRIHQDFFRQAILNAYGNTCCITGLNNVKLLEAAHIIPWNENTSLRTNPTNGLCLNPLFHSAYDNFLLSITPDFKICISDKFYSKVESKNFYDYLKSIMNQTILLPDKFYPSAEFLSVHHERYLNAQ